MLHHREGVLDRSQGTRPDPDERPRRDRRRMGTLLDAGRSIATHLACRSARSYMYDSNHCRKPPASHRAAAAARLAAADLNVGKDCGLDAETYVTNKISLRIALGWPRCPRVDVHCSLAARTRCASR